MKFFQIVLPAFFSLFVVGCSSVIEATKDTNPITSYALSNAKITDAQQNYIEDAHTVQLAEIIKIAEFQPQVDILRKRNNSGVNQIQTNDDKRLEILRRTVQKVFTVKDKDFAYMHIVNYKEGGYVIISADDRQTPILAFSEQGAVNEQAAPEGFILWAGKNKEDIELIKKGKISENPFAKREWAQLRKELKNFLPQNNSRRIVQSDEITTDNSGCISVTEWRGPYISTTWGQSCGYNDLIPFTCPDYCGQRAPTGCVTVAVAQVLKYWQYPAAKHNWSSMPLSTGNTEVATLMRDVASALNANFGCTGTGSPMGNVPGVFTGAYQFSGAQGIGEPIASNSLPIIMQELNYNRPVILSGFTGTFLGLFPTGDGHAWVCDGYLKTSYLSPCSGENVYLSMNWGWGTFSSPNGWYYHNDWHPIGTSYNFTYHKVIIANIHP